MLRHALSVIAAALEFVALENCDANAHPKTDALPIIRGEQDSPPSSPHPSLLRIVDWNIAAGRLSTIDTIAARLATFDADVITLQELDVDTQRSGEIDEPALLGKALAYDYVFAPIMPWDGGSYGIATLSRYALESVRRIPLSNRYAGEPRSAIDASLCDEGACVRTINHHADVELPAAEQSTKEIVASLTSALGTGVALLGDLNQVADDAGPQACLAAGLVDVGAALDASATQGDRRIDYAFMDNALAPCVRHMSVETTAESDHNALLIDLERECVAASAR
jgi:endonuclease/exonuclease/phosphatase family metal-dependent hydrolase